MERRILSYSAADMNMLETNKNKPTYQESSKKRTNLKDIGTILVSLGGRCIVHLHPYTVLSQSK